MSGFKIHMLFSKYLYCTHLFVHRLQLFIHHCLTKYIYSLKPSCKIKKILAVNCQLHVFTHFTPVDKYNLIIY